MWCSSYNNNSSNGKQDAGVRKMLIICSEVVGFSSLNDLLLLYLDEEEAKDKSSQQCFYASLLKASFFKEVQTTKN